MRVFSFLGNGILVAMWLAHVLSLIGLETIFSI